jgi:hypothetical protein
LGESIRREFSFDPVDTGRRQPQPPLATPPFLPGGQGIPGIGNQTLQPSAPILRPSFLSAFLSNLGPALAGGTATANGMQFGGLAGALGAIEEQKRYQTALQAQQQQQFWQRQMQQATQQRESALAQSTLQSQAQTREQQSQAFPLDIQEKQLGIEGQQVALQTRQGLLNLASNPQQVNQMVDSMTGNLGKLTSDHQALLDGAKQEFVGNLKQGKFDPTPIQAAMKTIVTERASTARGTDATPFKAWRDQFVKQMGREPNAQEITAFTTAGQAMRITGFENLRQDNYLDTTTGTVGTMTAGEFAAANKANPNQFVKYNSQVSNALKGQSLINDINAGIAQMRAAINDPNFKFSSKGRALMEVAAKSPETAVSTVMSGLAAQNLSNAEQNFVIARATLLERSMALRGLQSQGAGSDQQRRAIADMLVNFNTADKGMAEKQLRTLENNVNNVASAIPKIGKRGSGAEPPPAGMTRIRASDGSLHDIPSANLGAAKNIDPGLQVQQ